MRPRQVARSEQSILHNHAENLGKTRHQAGWLLDDVIGESNQTLYYMLEWDSLADREKKWNAFQADPEWHTARAKTEEAGPIVANVKNFILGPTPYSSV